MTENIKLIIDGIEVKVPKGTTVYQAAKQLKIEIPIFCYYDRMPPFGACRVCMVEVENMAKPQTSCTLEATEGMVVRTHAPKAVKARDEILEFLLINHPLDCPVCDRGGECPLQDQTVKYGPGMSRFFEDKRRFSKPVPRGPVLMLDRERCIQCARCTRFGDIVAGDNALEFVERGYKTEVATPSGGPAESKFIGNTIMICPVGALTSQVYRFRARPWDNEFAESTCTLCPVGCSMYIDSRDGEIVRTRSREDREVNDVWMCDKGWFGYEFADSPDRLRTPLIRQGSKLIETTWETAIEIVVAKINEFKHGGQIAGWGGTPLTVEENYQFQSLIRKASGTNHVDYRIGMPVVPGKVSMGMEIPIKEVEELSYAFLFGLDLTEEFPVIWLRLKQAINRGAKVVFIGHYAPEMAHHLHAVSLHAPGGEMEAIAQQKDLLAHLAATGKGALFVGRQYLANSNCLPIIEKLGELQQPHSSLSINLMEARDNSLGAYFAGMYPDGKGMGALEVLEKAAASGWDYLHVAGANPALKYPSSLWKKARSRMKFLVVQDLFLSETAQEADVVLPTLSYVEKHGSFINIENRVRELRPGKQIPENILSDGEIFNFIAQKLGMELLLDIEFSDKLRPNTRLPLEKSNSMSKKETPSPKGSLMATFARALFDNGVRMQHNPHVIQLAKPPYVRMHPNEAKKHALEDGDTVRINKLLTAKLKLDSQVAENTIVIPLGFKDLPAQELGPNLLNGMEITIERLQGSK